MLNGYPPKRIVFEDAAPVVDFVKEGDTIVVQTSTSSMASPKQPVVRDKVRRQAQAAPSTGMSRVPASERSIASQGEFVVREVPDDNSCLFRSVNNILGQGSRSVTPLRRIVATAIGNNPDLYNKAFLGRTNQAYKEWIVTDNAWGGAIELGILASHFRIEFGAFDVKTMRMDRYGEGNGFEHIGFLIYDGIHYNYLALALGGNTQDKSTDITQFAANDMYAVEKARQVAQIAHQAKQYTDTQNFLLKCNDCGARLRGEKDAVQHATNTSHTNFSES